MSRSDLDDARFDRALRACHAEAVDQVSAATMARLHRRRHAALSATPRPGRSWPLAATFAAALAVAVGLGLGLDAFDASGPAPAPAQVATGDDPLDEAFDGLDQNPDFYVWLASGDADLLAME